MNAGSVILGLIIGGVVGAMEGSFILGAVAGAVIGQLLSRIGQVEQRLRNLEYPPRKPVHKDIPLPAEPTATMVSQAIDEEPLEPVPAAKGHSPWQDPLQRPAPSMLMRLQPLIDKATTWFTTGNVPVKVGVVISFFGVAFLLKYAIDRELLVFPIEFRLLAVAAGGLAMIVIGWRLRSRVRAYALSLQGGGIGILFLTIFSAFRIWQLLPAPPAFFLLVALALFTGTLAVLQNASSLAILGIVGGFLAPVLTSTGQGNHVTLFSYYLLLNGAILGISWFRAWRMLNLLGFVFTFLVASAWGYQYYKPAFFTSTEPFLILYFLFYQAIAILYALRQPPERMGVVDGTLVFGTPAIVFALQAALMKGSEYGLAISAASLALFYALLATWLFRNKDEYLRLLTESFIALAVAFATLAIPLAVDARWTSAAWALEGAALVWIGTRQRHYLAGLAGVALVFLSGAAFIEHGWKFKSGLPLLNGNVLGGVLVSLSTLFAARKLDVFEDPDNRRLLDFLSALLFVWGVLWWLGTGFMEIMDWESSLNPSHQLLIFWAISAALAAWLGNRRRWNMLYNSSLLFLPLMALSALFAWITDQHVLFSLGWLAWPLAWVTQGFLLRLMDERQHVLSPAWHFVSLLLLSIVLAADASWWIGRIASEAWAGAGATMVLGVIALLVWRLRTAAKWPVASNTSTYLFASILLVAGQLLYLALLSIMQPGDADPWPYIPVLNPFDLGMLFAVLSSVLSLAAVRREAAHGDFDLSWLTAYRSLLLAAFFVMTTSALVRAVHQYTGVSWNGHALFRSDVVQTSLSIYWGLLGFVGMIWGARSSRRTVWLAGAAFMALVVIKLFLVDLGNTGTVERIVSFIGIGLLLLVVGYFAPAPPRQMENIDIPGDREELLTGVAGSAPGDKPKAPGNS